MIYLCPNCGQGYTNEDIKEFNKDKALFILLKHDIPSRVVADMMGDISHQGVRHRASKYAEKIGEEL